MNKKLLLLLPQTPFDPTSGAPRSMLSICRILAAAGWEVRTLCTTAFDSAAVKDGTKWHEAQGFKMRMVSVADSHRPVWRFEKDGISHCLVDTGPARTDEWARLYSDSMCAACVAVSKEFSPDVVLTYGGSLGMHVCRRVLREKGAAVVLGLRNHGYYSKTALQDVDRTLACSKWLADQYAAYFGKPVESLPPPLVEADIVPESREAVFFTFVNPSVHKGMLFFIRLADELARRRPDIPLLIVDAYARGGEMAAEAARLGADLRGHKSVMLAAQAAAPKDFLRVSRAVLVPSLWEEPFGRVAAEAQLVGIPAIVSGRGGLKEAVGEGGIVHTIPNDFTSHSPTLPPAQAVRTWIDEIVKMTDDEAYYKHACARAAKAGQRYRESVLGPQYEKFFEETHRLR
jgi:glycosyltransferase involved in cell wall biosynthesis